MKKIIIGLLIIAICFSTVIVVNAATTSKVTLQSITLIKNNHVGNNWTKTVKVNDKKLTIGKTYNISGTLNAYIKISENDKYPDIATKKVKLKKGTNTIYLTVIENKGRYKGNTAKWKVIIKVK